MRYWPRRPSPTSRSFFGVPDKGLGAGDEGAAMQVLAPPRTVAQVEIPVGGDLGGGLDTAFAG